MLGMINETFITLKECHGNWLSRLPKVLLSPCTWSPKNNFEISFSSPQKGLCRSPAQPARGPEDEDARGEHGQAGADDGDGHDEELNYSLSPPARFAHCIS